MHSMGQSHKNQCFGFVIGITSWLCAGPLAHPSHAYAKASPSLSSPSVEHRAPLPESSVYEEQQLYTIAAQIAAVTLRLDHAVQELATTAREGVTPQTLRARFDAAERLFLTENYEHACAMLRDMLDQPGIKRETWYATALYFVAESHFQMKSIISARTYFQQLLTLGTTRYMGWSVRRLIEIADILKDWTDIEKTIAAHIGRPPWPADVAYGYAKSLLRQNKVEDAIRVARTIAQPDPLYPQALYIIAVAELLQNKPNDAATTFAGITALPDLDYARGAYIRELAFMNRGRIFLDQGMTVEALQAYSHVHAKSPLFAETLYETAWIHIRNGNMADSEAARHRAYANALDILSQLVVLEERPHRQAEVRLLMGNLLLHVQRYGDAVKIFQDLVATYEPLYHDVASILAVATAIDPKVVFAQIVERRPGDMTYPLPSVAAGWLDEKDELHQAAKILEDMQQSAQWLEQAEGLLSRLQVVLSTQGASHFFPRFRDLRMRKDILEHEILAIRANMVALHRRILQPALDAAQIAELDRLSGEQRAMQRDFEHLPADEADHHRRMASVRAAVARMQQDVSGLGWTLQEQRQGVSALNQWLVDRPAGYTSQQLTDVHLRLAELAEDLTLLDALYLSVEAEIHSDAELIVAGLAVQVEESTVRAKYAALLDAQDQILKFAEAARKNEPAKGDTQRSGSDSAAPVVHLAWLDQMHDHDMTLGALRHKLNQFYDEFNRVADLRAAKMRLTLEQIGQDMRTQQTDMIALRTEAQDVAAQVAAASLRDVERQLRQMMFQGEVGITDVAWEHKEDETQVINNRLATQQQVTQQIDENYAEALKP